MSESLGLARKFSRPSFPQSSSGNPSQPDSAAAPPGCPLKNRGHDGIVHLGLWVAGVSPRCEIAIKRRKGRLTGVDDYLARYLELHEVWGFSTVVIEPADAVAAGTLCLPHDDPFDRMLIVQS